jgi:hypothetical protein
MNKKSKTTKCKVHPAGAFDPTTGQTVYCDSPCQNAGATAEDRAPFHPRYINIAALTDDARTISTQIWCSSMEDIYQAERHMNSWLLPDAEKWHGKVMTVCMFDTYQKTARNFRRVCDGLLKEVFEPEPVFMDVDPAVNKRINKTLLEEYRAYRARISAPAIKLPGNQTYRAFNRKGEAIRVTIPESEAH